MDMGMGMDLSMGVKMCMCECRLQLLTLKPYTGSNYQDTLKQHIDEQYIPTEYGGTCEPFGWKTPENNLI